MAFQQPQRGLAPSPPPGGEQSFEGFPLDTNTLSSTSTSQSPYSMSAMTYGSVSDWSGFAQDQNMDRKEDMQSSTLFSPNNPFSPEVGAPINSGSQPMYAYHPHQPGLANFNLMAGQFNQQPVPMQVQRPLLQTDAPTQQQQQHQQQQPMPMMPAPIQVKQEPLATVQFAEVPYEPVEQQQQQEPQATGGQPTRRNRTRAAATTPYQKPVVDTQALLAEEAKSLPKPQARKKKGPAKKKKEMQTDEEIAEAKRQQRLMRNRASAQASRERKKEHMSKLEKQVAELQALNAKLNAQVASLQRENDGLKQTRIIGNFNPAVSSSSEDDEAKSSPISPSSPLSDSSSPRLNPASPSMHGHNVHPLMARNLARTGMMLFALVFSVGMFYNMMELDIQQRNQAVMPSQAFRSRALQSLDEQMVQATNPALPAPMSVSQSQSDGVGGEGKESAEEDGSVKMDLDNNTSQAVNSDTLKKLPMIKPKSARTSASQSLLALALTQPQQESKTVMADNTNKAVDLWQEPAADVSSDPFAAMKDILLKSNSSSTEATYMLCPGAVQVRPTKGVKIAHNDTSGVYARLKRAGLPTPNMTDQDSAVEIDRIILSPRNNRLLLWVPTSSVVAGGAWDPALMEEPSGFKLTGLSELELRVSGIRPVLVAKNSMA